MCVIGLLARLLGALSDPVPLVSGCSSHTQDAVDHVESLLSVRWNEPLSLSELAREAGLSVFHLCRAFRRATGRTIRGYREQLRLRQALDEVREGGRSLVDIALDAGFCSHSHFGAVFRASSVSRRPRFDARLGVQPTRGALLARRSLRRRGGITSGPAHDCDSGPALGAHNLTSCAPSAPCCCCSRDFSRNARAFRPERRTTTTRTSADGVCTR